MSKTQKFTILFAFLIMFIFFIGIAASVFRVFFSSKDSDTKTNTNFSLKKIGTAPSAEYGEDDIRSWFEDTDVCLTSTVADVVFQSRYTDTYDTFSVSKYITIANKNAGSDASNESSTEEVYATVVVYQKDFDMYCSVEVDGETAYYYCSLKDVWDKETPPDFNVFSANMGFEPNVTDVVSVNYVETDAMGDKTYDVVRVGNTIPVASYVEKEGSESNESDAASAEMTTEDQVIYTNYYINTRTGKCEYMTAEENNTGLSIVTNVGKSGEISLPEGFLSLKCKKTDYATIEQYIFSFIYFMQ